MTYTLKKYEELLNRLILVSEIMDIPYFPLIQQKKQLKKIFIQDKCEHLRIEMKEISNTRIWRCSDCDKIIDYETIR